MAVDNMDIDNALADGFGHVLIKYKKGQHIEKCRPNHGLLRCEDAGGNDSGDGIGRIVEAVKEIKKKRQPD